MYIGTQREGFALQIPIKEEFHMAHTMVSDYVRCIHPIISIDHLRLTDGHPHGGHTWQGVIYERVGVKWLSMAC